MGVRHAWLVIGDYLFSHGITKILLPSYLCTSIITALESKGISCAFYQVNEDLSINLDDVVQKIDGHQAFYFINYFGFLHPPSVRFFIQNLQKHGILVVEDNAQAGFAAHSIGDFVFNSMRKLVPYDGGYLGTRFDMSPYIEPYREQTNRRLPIIRDYRSRLRAYLFDEQDCYEDLDALYQQAEHYYETEGVVLGDAQEKHAIEHLDWDGIKQIRRENYGYLLKLIETIPEIKPIYPALQEDNMPMGLPVYLKGDNRDAVLSALGEAGIGLIVHWEEISSHPLAGKNRTAVDMAEHMLTLPIDQRISRQQLEYLAVKLAGAVAA